MSGTAKGVYSSDGKVYLVSSTGELMVFEMEGGNPTLLKRSEFGGGGFHAVMGFRK